MERSETQDSGFAPDSASLHLGYCVAESDTEGGHHLPFPDCTRSSITLSVSP